MSNTPIVADQAGWKTVHAETMYQDKYVLVTMESVCTPTRGHPPVEWTVVHRKAAVVIIPLTLAGNFLLVQQERVPVRSLMWEFPAGQIDEKEIDDEVVRAAANRELREETGYELPPGAELLALGYHFSSPGFTDEHCHLFLARGVVPSPAGASHDDGEGIVDCREFSGDELRRMIAAGEINDANTLSAYARLSARGLF